MARRNPFKRRRPAEWEHMTRAQRSAWNKANWTPDQYVADKGLARDDRRLAKRSAAARLVQDRGVGIQALARALGIEVSDEEQEAFEARKSNPRRSKKHRKGELATITRLLSRAGIRHVAVKGRHRAKSRARSRSRRRR